MQDITTPCTDKATTPTLEAVLTHLASVEIEWGPLLLDYHGAADTQRGQIWQDAGEELRAAIATVALCLGQAPDDVMGRYRLAELVKGVRDDAALNRGARYGKGAVQKLKRFFGWGAGQLKEAALLADAYAREEAEHAGGLEMRDGRPVSYFHLVELARVEDRNLRQALLDRALAESWSVRALQRRAGEARKMGRTALAIPRGFDNVITQQADFVKDFLSRDEQVWSHAAHSLPAKVADLGAEDFTRERADRLKRLAEAMSELAKRAQERADEALALHGQFLEVIAGQTGKLKRLGE